MQYTNPLPNDLTLSEYLTERQKKALALRQQTTFGIKQATFDNFGLARPKNTHRFDSQGGY